MSSSSAPATSRFRSASAADNEPLLDEAINKVIAAAKRHGKFLGRPVGTGEQVPQYREQGFQLFQCVTDLGLMRLGAQRLLETVHRG